MAARDAHRADVRSSGGRGVGEGGWDGAGRIPREGGGRGDSKNSAGERADKAPHYMIIAGGAYT